MKKCIKIPFVILNLILTGSVFSKNIEIEKNEGFLRTKIFSNKELLTFNKLGQNLTFKTLNAEVYESLKEDFSDLEKNNPYIEKITIIEPKEGNTVFGYEVQLKKNVEIFSFYKQRENAYYIDFWRDGGEVKEKSAAIANVPAQKVSEVKVVKKPEVKQVVSIKPVEEVVVKKDPVFRDFRYGASFIWNYDPILPKISKSIYLDRKTPEFFYPVKDRAFDKSEKEAHLQLNVNLFRKKKWGLMAKSIKLYEEKYKADENQPFNEYLKANALLKDSTENGDIKPLDTAVAMFSNIAEKSQDYDMRKAIYKYLIQFYYEKNDNLSTLKYAKRYFADAKENFDYEELEYATEIVLVSLSNLNQIENIQTLISEKTIQKILPAQKLISYELYTLLKLGQEDQVIKVYENFRKSTKGEVLESILYNVAEAYFRKAEYEKAITVYDEFLSKYSFHTSSSAARLRIALASDLLARKEDEVLELYKGAINKSEIGSISTEARIRYVGLRSIRKIKQDSDDKEVRIFLDKGTDKGLDKNLEKLLWLTRLRTFIIDKKFEEALTFLTALPLSTMNKSDKVVFEGDGAEIIYGIIKHNYDNGEFARCIRAWEIYKDVYFEKVAADPEIQFIIAKSYANLGLWNGFERVYGQLIDDKKEKARTFPLWLARNNVVTGIVIEKELQVLRNIKLGNWASVESLVNDIAKMAPGYTKTEFYKAQALYMQKKYSQAEQEFERFFSKNINFSQIDGKDLVDSIVNYLESIYEQSKYDKFIDVSDALVKDASKLDVDKKAIQTMKERVSYLRIEILYSQAKPGSVTESENFLKDFKTSSYENRVKFLLGRENIRTNKLAEGEKILNDLINSSTTPEYIKEMARSELTLLNLKKRTL